MDTTQILLTLILVVLILERIENSVRLRSLWKAITRRFKHGK